MKLVNRRTPGQGLGDAGQGGKMGRSGEKKPSGTPVPVHDTLDRSKKIRRPVHFVDDQRSLLRSKKAIGVGQGPIQNRAIVECEVAGMLARRPGLDQRGLAHLAWPREEDDRKVP